MKRTDKISISRFLGDAGAFTLLEVLIALTILSIGILGITGLAGTAMKATGNSQAITQATNVAQDRLEAILTVNYQNLQASDTIGRADLRRTCTQTSAAVARPVYSCVPTTQVITVGNRAFAWSYTVTYIDLNNDGTADQSVDGLKRLDLTVSWVDPLWRATKSVQMATLRSRT